LIAYDLEAVREGMSYTTSRTSVMAERAPRAGLLTVHDYRVSPPAWDVET